MHYLCISIEFDYREFPAFSTLSEEDSCAGSKLLSGRSNRGNVPYPSLWLSYLALCPFGNTCSRLPILSVFIAIYAAS